MEVSFKSNGCEIEATLGKDGTVTKCSITDEGDNIVFVDWTTLQRLMNHIQVEQSSLMYPPGSRGLAQQISATSTEGSIDE